MKPPLSHFTSPGFQAMYKPLPAEVQRTADKHFALLKSDPIASLAPPQENRRHLVRQAGIHYRAVGMDAPSEERGILWIWIGSHAEYDRFIKQR